MRNNNTEGRRPARGGARKSPMGRSSFSSNGPRRNEGGRSFGSKRYSAGEGSVEGSADGSAKRSFGTRGAGAPRRFNDGERSERPRRFNDGERGDFKPRRFNDGERSERPRRFNDGERGDFKPRRFNDGERSERPRRFNDGERGDFKPRRFNDGERSERPRRFNDGERGDFKPRRFNDGERSERPRRFNDGERGDFKPRRFNDGERSERPRRFNDGERGDFKPRRFNDGERSERKPYNNAEKFGGKRFAPKPRFTDEEGNEVEYKRPQAQSYTPKPRQPRINGEEGVRLNKFIANSGICSRREADDYITAGLVSVNDVIITELGTRVFKNDVVKFNDERIKGEEKVYIVMNKPKDFVTTMSDPYAERTIMQLIEGKCKERVFPVGRLDKATTGVLLITNDGDLADKLTHPSYEKKKIYHVFLDKNFRTADFDTLLNGVELEDGTIKADGLSYIDEDKAQIGVEVHSGRNRIVRRMFEHLGYKIKKLDRVYFAGLTKKNLRRGQWRFLDDQEVAMLKMGSYE